MHWTELPIHVIDFEGNRSYGIVEFGVATLEGGEVVETSTRICRAKEPIDPREERLHGIRFGDTQESEPFEAEWERFTNLRKSGPFAAHHAPVDAGLLKSAWPYPPFSPNFLGGADVAEWGPWIDSRRLYAQLFPQYESHKLSELVAVFHLGEEVDALAESHCPENRRRFHCALYDALASAALLKRLGELAGFGGITIEWLLQHSLPSAEARDRAAQGELFEG